MLPVITNPLWFGRDRNGTEISKFGRHRIRLSEMLIVKFVLMQHVSINHKTLLDFNLFD